MREQREALLGKDSEMVIQVIQVIEELGLEDNASKNKREKLLGYYRDNLERMRYSVFRGRGLVIGSEAIESVHKATGTTQAIGVALDIGGIAKNGAI